MVFSPNSVINFQMIRRKRKKKISNCLLLCHLRILDVLIPLQLANHLDRAVSNLVRDPLKVLIQVNTSGEICKLPGSLMIFVRDHSYDWLNESIV